MKTIIFVIGLTVIMLSTQSRIAIQKVDVVKMGESLSTRLKVPMGSSDDLINDLIAYYVYVENCLKKQNVHVPERKVIESLIKYGGPPHIKVSVNNKFLKEYYNLSEVEVDEVQEVLVDTKVLWKNMKNITIS